MKKIKTDSYSKATIPVEPHQEIGFVHHLPDETIRNFLHYISFKHIELALQDNGTSFMDDPRCKKGPKEIEHYDFSPLGCLILSIDGVIIEANDGLEKMLGYQCSELSGLPFDHFVDQGSKSILLSFLADMYQYKAIETCEIRLISITGTILYAHLTGSIIKEKNHYIINIIDTTELVLNISTLGLYHNMLQNISEGVLLIRISDQIIVYSNPALEQIFGYATYELTGKKISILNAPTNKSPEVIAKDITNKLQKAGSWQGEIKSIRKDGTTFWSYANVSTFEDPKYGKVWVSIHMDITERKLAQAVILQSKKDLQADIKVHTRKLDKINEKLRLELIKRKTSQDQLKTTLQNFKNLYAYLQRVREEEQINIARIIHDDIAQLLTTLKIELTLFKEKNSLLEQTKHHSIDYMLQLTDDSLASITSIITELRPVIIDKMGLVPAIKLLFINFQEHTGIICDLRIKQELILIKDEVATSIYRVVQELLTNIRNHSKASLVTIKIAADASSFIIEVKDNGIGITPEEVAHPRSFGIIGMKERIMGINGTIIFKGVSGKGTTVKIKIPNNS